MVEYDWPDVYEEQQAHNRCIRWTNNAIWCVIVGCHIYMITTGINPYGLV